MSKIIILAKRFSEMMYSTSFGCYFTKFAQLLLKNCPYEKTHYPLKYHTQMAAAFPRWLLVNTIL